MKPDRNAGEMVPEVQPERWPNHVIEAGTAEVPIGIDREFLVIDDGRATTLRHWCSTLIPATETRPAAGEVGAAEFVDATCAAAPRLVPMLEFGLDRIDQIASQLYGIGFAECDTNARQHVVHELETAHPDVLAMVRDFTYEAYYGHPVVLAALEADTGWRGTAPGTGSSMSPFEHSKLARVLALPPLYRQIGSNKRRG